MVLAPLFAVGLVAAPCHAQVSGGDVAAAQELFEDGKRSMEQHDYATACPKLAESFRLDAAGGTALALAICLESQGKTASAWADYNRALAIARRDHRADRETAAAKRASALEQRLVRLRIVVQADTPGLELVRDGELVGRAQWGIPVPVDPGPHAFEARAPGKIGWSTSVATGPEGTTVDVVVPALADQPAPAAAPPIAPAAAPVASSPAAAAPTPSAPPASDKAPSSGSSLRTWSFALGGVGLASVAAGAGFGIAASSKWSDAQKACPRNVCPQLSAQQAGLAAGRDADIATIAIGAGAVAIVAAGMLYFLGAPSEPEPAQAARLRVVPSVSPQGAGLSVGGAL